MLKEDLLTYIEKKKELEKLFDSFEDELINKVIEVLTWKNEISQKFLNRNEYRFGDKMGVTNIDDDNIYVKTWGRYDGYYEASDRYIISFTELFSDEWKADYILKFEKKKKEIELDKEAKERELLAKLKAKYEG